MKTPRAQVAAVLAKKSLSSGTSQPRLAREVAAFLLENGRIGELDSLMRDIIADRAEQGIVEVTAVSARALTPANLAEVKAQAKALYPAAKQIIINQRRDSSVIAGVRLELVDKQLDLSVRKKLNRFKERTSAHGAL